MSDFFRKASSLFLKNFFTVLKSSLRQLLSRHTVAADMNRVSARNFDNLKDFLHFQIEKSLLSANGRKISNLETIAKELGYKSPSILTMVLKGQRLPSDDMIDAMSEHWKLTSSDREFFRLLVQAERRKKKGRDISQTTEKLRKLAKNKNPFVISLQQFHLIKDWFYHVVKALIMTPGFVEDPLWISRKLRKKITPAQAKKAIDTLVELGICHRDPVSGALKLSSEYTETTHDTPSEAFQGHHQGMIHRALEALEEQPIEKRHFNSLTLQLAADRVPEAKARILQFVRDFYTEFDNGHSNQVFQLNVQFFEHTREDGVLLRSASDEIQ
jgi:uncharacterized protein (TIGR02147 family)